MAAAGPYVAPQALNLVTAVKVKFLDIYDGVYAGPEYKSYEEFVYAEDPAGDLIYSIYSQPMKPMQEWLKDRKMSAASFKYTTYSPRPFADSMEIDTRDIRDDANPAKVQMYLEAAARFGEATAALWPSLVAETLFKGIGQTWLPDGQHVLDLHNFDPDGVVSGNFRNYFANNSQGGSAAYALTYGNLLARLGAGYSFKAPTGLDYPIRYTHLIVPPSSFPTATRLLSFDRLPLQEVYSAASSAAGGDTINQIKNQYGNVKPVMLANMPAGTWALVDASSPSKRAIGLKKRQDVIWQQIGPGGPAGPFPTGSREGMVSEMTFNTNKSKYGPYAEGEAFFRNWWGVALMDGNASPVTSLNLVSAVI
jgi:phage major head subunit gpT-like protein